MWLSCVSYPCNWAVFQCSVNGGLVFLRKGEGRFDQLFWCKGLTFLQMKSDSLGWALGMVGYVITTS